MGEQGVGVFVWVETSFYCSSGLHTLIPLLHRDEDNKLRWVIHPVKHWGLWYGLCYYTLDHLMETLFYQEKLD